MSKPAAPAPKAKQAARTPADGTSETDADMEWDDALAMPASAAPLDALGTGPAYAMRRTTPEPIEPMTMYAIWIGGGAVVLLVLLILGHIIWNAFADSDGREGPADQPTESAPIEPGGSGEPGEGSASETQSPASMVTIDE